MNILISMCVCKIKESIDVDEKTKTWHHFKRKLIKFSNHRSHLYRLLENKYSKRLLFVSDAIQPSPSAADMSIKAFHLCFFISSDECFCYPPVTNLLSILRVVLSDINGITSSVHRSS